MSGGVDSSVAAALLLEQGYDVTGVFIKSWQPPFLECGWRKERDDAMRVASRLGIPFKTFDTSDVYKKDVVDYLIDEYRAGRTPNPDAMCNKKIKFGAFRKWAVEHGADCIATGHYARIEDSKQGRKLLKGVDIKKDQSYFLWTLTQEMLSQILFPIGLYQKDMVRTLAKERGLQTASKKDSQGVCMLGELSMKDFLSHYIESKPGRVLDISGSVIGSHPGAFYFTIGERRGFDVKATSPQKKALYVIAKDVDANTITVSPEKLDSSRLVLQAFGCNWITSAPATGSKYEVRIRHGQVPVPYTVSSVTKESVEITAKKPISMVSAGQSLVLYDGDVCIGGGVIV